MERWSSSYDHARLIDSWLFASNLITTVPTNAKFDKSSSYEFRNSKPWTTSAELGQSLSDECRAFSDVEQFLSGNIMLAPTCD